MREHRNKPGSGKRDLAGAVIAFDLDNTLLDPDRTAYTRTLDEFFSGMKPILGDAREAIDAYERVRACGDALASCGLGNLIHERGHPEGLAVLLMLEAHDADLCQTLGIDTNTRRQDRARLEEQVKRHRATREGDCESRLLSECRLRALSSPGMFPRTEPRASARADMPESSSHFTERARRISKTPCIVEWSASFRAIERNQPLHDHRPFFAALTERGAIPVLITEGRLDIQAEKVDRLGLTSVFDGRLLTTEAAADVPGRAALDEAIDDRIDAALRLAHLLDGELIVEPDQQLWELWWCRSVLQHWATKSTWFYARCLHAIHFDPDRPQDALQPPRVVSKSAWRENPLRFVMAGDRYDKDVAPIIELLDKDHGLTVRLQQGKYGDRNPTETLPRRDRPDHTFSDWAGVEGFLLEALRIANIPPIEEPPQLVPPSKRFIEAMRGESISRFGAVRAIVAAGAATYDTRSQEPTTSPRLAR